MEDTLKLVLFAIVVITTLTIVRVVASFASSASKEPFLAPPALSSAIAKVTADPLKCMLQPSDYEFETQALAAHPGNTLERPRCVIVREGLGLIDPTTCALFPDRPSDGWTNPLAASPLVRGVVSERVGGLDRCAIQFVPGATAADLARLDADLSMAGAQVRSDSFALGSELGRVSDELRKADASLVRHTDLFQSLRGGLDSAASDMDAMAISYATLKASSRDTLEQVRAANVQAQSVANSGLGACYTDVSNMTANVNQCRTSLEACQALKDARARIPSPIVAPLPAVVETPPPVLVPIDIAPPPPPPPPPTPSSPPPPATPPPPAVVPVTPVVVPEAAPVAPAPPPPEPRYYYHVKYKTSFYSRSMIDKIYEAISTVSFDEAIRLVPKGNADNPITGVLQKVKNTSSAPIWPQLLQVSDVPPTSSSSSSSLPPSTPPSTPPTQTQTPTQQTQTQTPQPQTQTPPPSDYYHVKYRATTSARGVQEKMYESISAISFAHAIARVPKGNSSNTVLQQVKNSSSVPLWPNLIQIPP